MRLKDLREAVKGLPDDATVLISTGSNAWTCPAVVTIHTEELKYTDNNAPDSMKKPQIQVRLSNDNV